jgi:hypothetical protein
VRPVICTAGPIVPELLDYCECHEINGAGRVIDKTRSCDVTRDGGSFPRRQHE